MVLGKKKKTQKENSAFLRHYKRPTEDEQGRQLEEILERASQTPSPSHHRRRGEGGPARAAHRQNEQSSHRWRLALRRPRSSRAACACPLFSRWPHYYAHFIDEKIKKLATRRWSCIPRTLARKGWGWDSKSRSELAVSAVSRHEWSSHKFKNARGGQETGRGVEGLELISACERTKITANGWTAIDKKAGTYLKNPTSKDKEDTTTRW